MNLWEYDAGVVKMKNKLFLILLIAIMMFGITECANINNNEVVDNNLNNNDVMNEDTNLINKEPNISLGKYTICYHIWISL